MTLLGLQAPIVPQKFFHWLMGFPGDSDGKEFTCSAGDMGSIPGLGKSPGEGTGYPLQYSCLVEKEMATHSSILAWRILWTEEPGGLLCMGSHRVRHNWSDLACMHALEKEMATHSNILTWRIPGTEEPGWLLSMGSHRIRHDWSDLAAAAVRFWEKAMAPHSSTLAWKIPWMEEPGRLQSMGSLRVVHDFTFTFTRWRRKRQPTPVFLPGESQGRGSLKAAIYGVAQSRTQLKWLSNSSNISVWSLKVCVGKPKRIFVFAKYLLNPGLWSQGGLKKHYYKQN